MQLNSICNFEGKDFSNNIDNDVILIKFSKNVINDIFNNNIDALYDVINHINVITMIVTY